jgi:hypothetical protein
LNDATVVLRRISELATANKKTAAVLGARAVVLGTFLEAVLPCLTTLQRAEVARSFRQGIEDAMSLMDDVAMPVEYHSTLLELTNAILASSARRQ